MSSKESKKLATGGNSPDKHARPEGDQGSTPKILGRVLKTQTRSSADLTGKTMEDITGSSLAKATKPEKEPDEKTDPAKLDQAMHKMMQDMEAKLKAEMEVRLAAVMQKSLKELDTLRQQTQATSPAPPPPAHRDPELDALRSTLELVLAEEKAEAEKEAEREKREIQAQLAARNQQKQKRDAEMKRKGGGKSKGTGNTHLSDDDDKKVSKPAELRNNNCPLVRIKYMHELLSMEREIYLAYAIEFNSNGTYRRIISSAEKTEYKICSLSDVNNPDTVCPAVLLMMMLDTSNAVVEKYGDALAAMFKDSKDGAMTGEIAEQLSLHCTLAQGEPEAQAKGLKLMKYSHNPACEPHDEDRISDSQATSLDILSRGFHEAVNNVIMHENLSAAELQAKQQDVNIMQNAQALNDRLDKDLKSLMAITNADVEKMITSPELAGSKPLPPSRLASIEVKGVFDVMNKALLNAGVTGWRPHNLELLSAGAQMAEFTSISQRNNLNFQRVYQRSQQPSSTKESSRPGDDQFESSETDGPADGSIKAELMKKAQLFNFSPLCTPFGNALQIQQDQAKDFKDILTGKGDHLNRSMVMAYHMKPLVVRAQELGMANDSPELTRGLSIIDAAEKKAAELIMGRLERIEKASKDKSMMNYATKIKEIVAMDKRRRANGDQKSIFAGTYMHDPLTHLLRSCNPSRFQNIGLASFVINVICILLSDMNQGGQANSKGMTRALCNLCNFDPTKTTPMAFLMKYGDEATIMAQQVTAMGSHPGPFFHTKVLNAQLIDWGLTTVLQIPMIHAGQISESEQAKFRKLQANHEKYVEDHIKENPEANGYLVLSSVYGSLRQFVQKHNQILSSMSKLKPRQNKRNEGASAAYATGDESMAVDPDRLDIIADNLNNDEESSSITLFGNAPTLPGGGDDGKRGRGRGRGRGKPNDDTSSGDMPSEAVEFVKAADRLSNLMSLVLAQRKDGADRSDRDSKIVPKEDATAALKAFGFFAPDKYPKENLGEELRKNTSARKQFVMAPWVKDGAFKELEASGFKRHAIKSKHITAKEYDEILADIIRTSITDHGSRSFNRLNFGQLMKQLEAAKGSSKVKSISIINDIKEECKKRGESAAMTYIAQAFLSKTGDAAGAASTGVLFDEDDDDDDHEEEQQDSSSSKGKSKEADDGTKDSSSSGKTSVSALTESSNGEVDKLLELERLKLQTLQLQEKMGAATFNANDASDETEEVAAIKAALSRVDLNDPKIQAIVTERMTKIQDLTRKKNLGGLAAQKASLDGTGGK